MKKLFPFIVAAGLATVFTAKAADVQENWKTHCAKCHGENGKGETKMGKKMGCKDFSSVTINDDKALKAIKDGLKEGDKTLMQPFGDKLNDDEIKALIAHVHSFKK